MTPRVLLRAASLVACLAGAAMVAQGSWVPVKAEVAQVELEERFERDLVENLAAKPAPIVTPAVPKAAVMSPEAAASPSVKLSTASAKPRILPAGSPIARIAVDRLEIRGIVLSGTASHEQLAKGPAVVKQATAESPVTILAAHRDTHFAFIRNLQSGDIVTMQYVTGEVERYRVTTFETVRWNEFAYPLDPARPLLALTTCYPFGGTEYGTPWRRVAWAEKID